jgi:integrase/recombinase XerD
MGMDQIKILDEFAADLRDRGLSKYTVLTYPKYALALSKFTGGDLLAVNEEMLGKYLSHLRAEGIAQTSLKRYFASLSTFYEFLVYKKYITLNPVSSAFKKRYLKSYKSHNPAQRRQCPTVEQVRLFVAGIPLREKAPIVLLFKTGIRRSELTSLDVNDLDLEKLTIYLKPTGKRSNEVVYFDPETRLLLAKWLQRREKIKKKNRDAEKALFLDSQGGRLQPVALYVMFRKHATFAGLHDPASEQLRDKLSPHCARHWFTTQLLERSCPREFVQELRGDNSIAAVDIYSHLDPKKLKQSYLDCIPSIL